MRFFDVLKAAGAAGLVCAGACFAWRALASDETRIRWRIEEMVEGFNDCRTARVVRGLAPTFRDETSGLTREEIREILVYTFFSEIDPETKRFLLSAELAKDGMEIEVLGGDPRRAKAAVSIRFLSRRKGEERIFWDARVEGELEKGEDGWQWARTTQVNHRDRESPRRREGR